MGAQIASNLFTSGSSLRWKMCVNNNQPLNTASGFRDFQLNSLKPFAHACDSRCKNTWRLGQNLYSYFSWGCQFQPFLCIFAA